MQMKKILVVVIILCGLVGGLWYFTHKGETKPPSVEKQTVSNNPNDAPHIVSTKPDPLEDTILSASEPVEITFNRPIQNSGEFKLKIEPKIDFKISLSPDRKTAQISFVKPLELGVTYTLFIGTDTKFDGMGEWGVEKIYHIKTVAYHGV